MRAFRTKNDIDKLCNLPDFAQRAMSWHHALAQSAAAGGFEVRHSIQLSYRRYIYDVEYLKMKKVLLKT